MSAIDRLLDIMAALRDPEKGCAWDSQQTFATIAPHTLEEAYEVTDAIARADMPALKEELGDLLLQVVFHAQMAREENLFSFDDVAGAIADKLVRRHPHVFSAAKEHTADEQVETWEAIKLQEKAGKPAGASVLDDIPLAMPALYRAAKLQKRAARLGFDWPDIAPVLEKIEEEIGELRREIQTNAPKERIAEELGDILFACVNLARHLKLDAEEVLREGNRKFERRFREVEKKIAAASSKPTLAQMDAWWDEAKKEEA